MKIVPNRLFYGIIEASYKRNQQGETMTSIGARVRSLREDRGWSQEDLARESELQRPHISLIENNERTPGADSLIKLATALETSADFLLGLSDIPVPTPAPNHASYATREFRQLAEAWAYLSDAGAKEFLEIIRGLAVHYKEFIEDKGS